MTRDELRKHGYLKIDTEEEFEAACADWVKRRVMVPADIRVSKIYVFLSTHQKQIWAESLADSIKLDSFLSKWFKK